MLNDKPCGKCQHFDPVMRGAGKEGVKETTWGWCAKKSLYPYAPGPGQLFPAGVKRAEKGQPSKPKIVRKPEIVSNCNGYQPRKPQATKADLLKKLKEQAGGVLR